MTIPSPTALHFRFGRKYIDPAIYPDMDGFFADLGAAYADIIAAFGRAGCRYLQLDEVYLAYLCDPEQRATLAARGEDPDALPATYARLINRAIAGAPPGMTLAMHLCRGNFRSSFVASGGYEPVAELLFNGIGIHAYFMEYDSERAGGFEPLRLVPKDKSVVLGLVTTKSGGLEARDELKRRIDAAAKFVPLERLCLSPQCGFASTEEGNLLTEDEQWRKLALVVEVAAEVWGGG
jgi:5-methyltetrahydropteroyltriglutamate--homocysteine methyltransferase